MLGLLYIYAINVKNEVYKNGYSRRSCTSKTAKIHRLVTFVMYCFITTVLVAFYWARSDETVHYKCVETVNFCGFRCATTSPITVFFYKLCFPELVGCNADTHACTLPDDRETPGQKYTRDSIVGRTRKHPSLNFTGDQKQIAKFWPNFRH